MNINDETLSAFLDNELPEAEMNRVRDLLAADEHLANRLADLAMVDTLVSQHACAIDHEPLPEAINALLATKPVVAEQSAVQASSSNVVPFPFWKRVHKTMQEHASMAAAIALMIGFGSAQIMPNLSEPATTDLSWTEVANILDSHPSGQLLRVTSDIEVTPLLSFVNHHGELCRQFLVQNPSDTKVNIACRKKSDEANEKRSLIAKEERWQLAATVYSATTNTAPTYQTASNNSLSNALVEQMAEGQFLDDVQESKAIANDWQASVIRETHDEQ